MGGYSPEDCEPLTPTPLERPPNTHTTLSQDLQTNPTLYLPHVLRALGPSSLTLYKHILGRRRVLIYTSPPVEPACVLCQVAADMCFEAQTTPSFSLDEPSAYTFSSSSSLKGKLKDKATSGVKILGVVTLHDLDRLHEESMDGRGWVACTTDAIFLEKPQYYDLLLDLTAMPTRGGRPTMASPKPSSEQSFRSDKYKLSTVRFTWSDVKLVRGRILPLVCT
jgi:hypothetical protein